MKKLFLFLAISFSLQAQSDSLKVTFSEEKVEKFEKTTLIDEYEKAFGGNRVVKSGLRARYDGSQKEILDGINFQFEQKVFNTLSVVGSFSGGIGSKQGIRFNTSMEGRWYYLMKKRMAQNKQKPNLTGSFLSLRANYFSDGKSEQPTVNILSSNSFSASSSINPIFIKSYSLSALWGKQFGNNLEFGIMAGINYGNQFFDRNLYFPFGPSGQTFEPIDIKKVFLPYFSTFSQIGIGVFYPKKVKGQNQNCEFLKCNYLVNRMFKLNLNDAVYIDKFVQRIKFDVGYEQRISKSKFSINTFATIDLNNFKTREILNFRDTVVTRNDRIINASWPIYSLKSINDFTTTVAGTAQLRYYLISKNKSFNNLNGMYTGLEYSQRNTFFTTLLSHPQLLQKSRTLVHTFSGIIGYQTQTNLGSFLDFTAAFGMESINTKHKYKTGYSNFKQVHFELSIKLGLAK